MTTAITRVLVLMLENRLLYYMLGFSGILSLPSSLQLMSNRAAETLNDPRNQRRQQTRARQQVD